MVIEFVELSPKKQEDSNDDDGFYNQSQEKLLVSESSDEDTTSSSLLPIPNTLDEMRNELKSTLNNFCGTDFESEMPNITLNLKHPTEREMSIARKITSANLLLDDLLNNTDIYPKEENPIVFNAKVIRQKGKKLDSETVTDQEESSSSTDRCLNIPVTPFIYPTPVCDCSRCPCERKETTNEGTEQSEKIIQPKQPEPKKSRPRFILSEKMKLMRLKCRKKKKTSQVQETQTESILDNPPGSICSCQKMQFYDDECACRGDSHPDLECACHRVIRSSFKECPCDSRRPSFKECSCSPLPKSSFKECQCDSQKPSFKECNCPPVTKSSFKECHCDTQTKVDPPEHQKVAETQPSPEENGNVRDTEIIDKLISEQPSGNPVKTTPAGSPDTRERIDIYYFDHGNSAYYRTTDSHPAKYTEYMIERTDEYATKFWAEIFGTITIAFAFIISFILQLYRCLFTAIIRALTVGLIQIFSDYFFKPLLTVIFNGLIQPCLILGYNIATSTKDFCVPICEICEFCAKDLSIIFRSCRVVEINQATCSSPSCHCRQKV